MSDELWQSFKTAFDSEDYAAMVSVARQCGLDPNGCEAPELLWNMVGRHLGVF